MNSTSAQSRMPSGSSSIPTRMMPKAPSFISTPACSMLTVVGAATCPSGDHVCSGHIPASSPNPTITSGKTTRWNSGEKPGPPPSPPERANSESAGMLNVPRPASLYMTMIATHTSRLAATIISTSFIAPYSLGRSKVLNLVLDPHTPMSRYIGTMASS